MEEHIIYNGISYTRHGDYYFPDLEYHTTNYPNQMKWVQLMNLAHAEAENHIVQEIIFE